jgi:IS30 family transposase
MKRPYHRVGFTAAQSAELWDRWRRGEGLKAIGRVIGKPSSCVFGHLSLSGGIRPPPRRRSRLALTLAEREEISRNLAAGQSLRSIARTLGRPASTEPIPRARVAEKMRGVLTPDEVARLVDAAPGAKYRAALSVA